MISPTGIWKTRIDTFGDGSYGARRTKTNGKRYRHRGQDFICTPGQTIVSPFDAVYKRIAYPYANNQSYTGALFENEWCEFKMFYFEPKLKTNQSCKQGQVVGIAQDISAMYGKDNNGVSMVPHVHFEFVSVDPEYIKAFEERIKNGPSMRQRKRYRRVRR